MLTLFVLPRKGLYQLTICKNCGHKFECPNCDANLVTYRKTDRSLELFCHQCQTYHEYPVKCPVCSQSDIISRYGAIEELAETLENQGAKIHRLDKAKLSKKPVSPSKIFQAEATDTFLTTRLFDPALKYDELDRIVFVNAENLLASPDYLVQEETTKSLAEVFLRVRSDTEVVFDVVSENSPMIKSICRLSGDHPSRNTVFEWYREFLQHENESRKKFGFPPHKNVLLITTQEKKRENSFQKLKQIQMELKKYLSVMPELEISSPYPARFFRRKNMYSQHLLVKYPRQFAKFAELREVITGIAEAYQVQVRLNPRHLF